MHDTSTGKGLVETMDDILEMAKDLGYAIQQDERFIRTQLAQAAADDDEALQGMIGEFNLKRMAINTENTKAEKDEHKLQVLDGEMREVYARIMANPHMAEYQEAKERLDALLNRIGTIISLSAQGQDPDTAAAAGGCSGSCSSCGGCH